jgi:hypothetical protein
VYEFDSFASDVERKQRFRLLFVDEYGDADAADNDDDEDRDNEDENKFEK